jgi:hypothetical protein
MRENNVLNTIEYVPALNSLTISLTSLVALGYR